MVTRYPKEAVQRIHDAQGQLPQRRDHTENTKEADQPNHAGEWEDVPYGATVDMQL